LQGWGEIERHLLELFKKGLELGFTDNKEE
jgi:hypothetical protein